MIKNDRQYCITKAQAEKFERAVKEAAASPRPNVHPALRKAKMDALKSHLADLREELEEYTALRSGKRKTVSTGSLDELPRTLIRVRIAAGLTRKSWRRSLA